MPRTDITDRASIERAYPRAAFDEDVRLNAQPNAEMRHGVRVEASRIVRATQHVGEMGDGRHALFLQPEAASVAAAATVPPETGDLEEAAPAGAAPDYDRFVDQLIEAARGFEPAKRPSHDDRLKGFRGG